MISKILFTTIFICSVSHASDFLLGFTYKKSLGYIKIRTSLFIFDDGTYLLNTSSGGVGLCQNDGRAGKFKGKLSKDDLKQIKDRMDQLPEDCSQSSACIKSPSDQQISTFTLLDYRTKNQKRNQIYSFTNNDASLIEYLILKSSTLKQTPIRSLSLELEKQKINIKYRGEKLKVAVGIKNFIVLKKSGAFVDLSDYAIETGDSSVITMSNNKTKYVYEPKLDWKSLKEDGQFLIYNNKVDAHHLDIQKEIYSPCISL